MLGLGDALDLDRESRRAHALLAIGDAATALEMYDRLIERAPNPALFVERGFARLDAQDPDGAMADANAALARDPKAAGAYRLRAIAHAERGDKSKALSDISLAIDADPDDNGAYAMRAWLHCEAERLDFALSDVFQAVALAPGVADHHGLEG